MKSIYVPLWVKSNYSFLEGASHPDELVEQAAALGLPAIAITDRDGVYGIVKAHKAAKERGIKLIVGSEITVELGDEKNDRETGGALEGNAAGGSGTALASDAAGAGGTALASDTAGPGGTAPARSNATRGSTAPASETTGRRFRTTVVLLATNREGYANLCSLISAGRLRCAKGESLVTLATVEQYAAGLLCLSGCSVTELGGGDGVTAAGAGGYAGLSEKEMRKAANRFETESSESLIPKVRDTLLGRLSDAFPNSLYLQDTRHREPREPGHLQIIEELSRRFELPIAAATEVLYHTPERRELADVVAAIRHGVTLHAAGSRLAANGTHALLSPHEMRDRYADRPRHVERTFEIAERCRFSLDEIKYRYPTERVPQGYSTSEWLWELTFSGARKRYGGSIPADVRSQLQRELEVIDDLEYCGYFLTMWEIIEYCRRQGILAQGRGSAANSAVCYCLGITAVDPVRMELLFERFLSRERAEPPDIDLDIEHRRREEVIQHMYEKYGRDRAAMVANVIRYRVKSAIRDVGKVLGFPETALDRMAKLASARDSNLEEVLDAAGVHEHLRELFGRLALELLEAPRHLSIHPGGFLLGSEPVHRLVPIENATMPDRTVIQWDKYDVEEMNLFKVDLLGLGALTHLDYCFRLLKMHRGIDLSMATIPHDDPAVFKMLAKADTVGVFQLESRAQMAMLPRLRPRIWYDIVIQVSIVRPGPITGGMVHPYLRRRAGEEEVVYPHPALEPVLKKTLGVPIFQEQVMKLAVVAADYTPGEADQLRRDMAAWRKSGRIEKHHERMVERMTAKGIELEFAEAVFQQIKGFGEYGFPESHAASFSLIAYCTAWVRAHYPAEFACGLLNAWPMGFYSPASIVADAKRHGIEMRSIDVLKSDWDCTLERDLRTRGGYAVRMGLRYVRGISESDYRRIVRARRGVGRGVAQADAPDRLLSFARAADLGEDLLVALARAGAFGGLGLSRRQALWEVSGSALRREADRVHHRETGEDELVADGEVTPDFDPLSDFELVAWDYYTASHSTASHPLEPHRDALREAGHPTAREVFYGEDGSRTSYVGLVITRQRPSTAGGIMFVTLEDETGYVNLVVWKQVLEKYRPVLLTSAVLGVEGRIQTQDGVTHLVVEHCFKPQLSLSGFRIESRNFR